MFAPEKKTITKCHPGATQKSQTLWAGKIVFLPSINRVHLQFSAAIAAARSRRKTLIYDRAKCFSSYSRVLQKDPFLVWLLLYTVNEFEFGRLILHNALRSKHIHGFSFLSLKILFFSVLTIYARAWSIPHLKYGLRNDKLTLFLLAPQFNSNHSVLLHSAHIVAGAKTALLVYALGVINMGGH